MTVSTFMKSGVAIATLIAAGAVAAYTPDTLLGSATLGSSGEQTEEEWLEGLALAGDLELDPTAGVVAYDAVNNNWFIDVNPDEPGYFTLKFGVGNSGLATHYAFTNIAELTKLVWTDGQVNGLMSSTSASGCTFTISSGEQGGTEACGKLSHFRVAGSSSTGVPSGSTGTPEPGSGTLALLGLGLLGAGFVKRRKAQGD